MDLQRSVLVKCGGFSTQLATHVGERIDGDPLWGSRYDLVNPTAVVKTHLDFLESKLCTYIFPIINCCVKDFVCNKIRFFALFRTMQ